MPSEWSYLEIGKIGWTQWEVFGMRPTLVDVPGNGWIWLEVIERL